MHARSALLLTAILTVALSGCASVVPGRPLALPAAQAHAENLSSAKVLGDYRTVDPCDLIDIESLPGTLNATLEPTESLDYCALSITSAGQPAQLEVGALSYYGQDGAQAGTPLQGLDLDAGSYDDTYGACTDFLEFVDDVDLDITAFTTHGSGSDDLCQAAGTAARNVAGVLARGPVRHRSFPTGSFATLDACSLLTQDLSIRSTHIGTGYDTVYPAHHECDWGNGIQQSYSLTFIVGPQPDAQQDGGSAVSIAGRASVTYSATDSGTGECWIDTAGSPFAGAQPGLVQIAEVYVTEENTDATTTCADATTLATALWPRLPTAS